MATRVCDSCYMSSSTLRIQTKVSDRVENTAGVRRRSMRRRELYSNDHRLRTIATAERKAKHTKFIYTWSIRMLCHATKKNNKFIVQHRACATATGNTRDSNSYKQVTHKRVEFTCSQFTHGQPIVFTRRVNKTTNLMRAMLRFDIL